MTDEYLNKCPICGNFFHESDNAKNCECIKKEQMCLNCYAEKLAEQEDDPRDTIDDEPLEPCDIDNSPYDDREVPEDIQESRALDFYAN